VVADSAVLIMAEGFAAHDPITAAEHSSGFDDDEHHPDDGKRVVFDRAASVATNSRGAVRRLAAWPRQLRFW